VRMPGRGSCDDFPAGGEVANARTYRSRVGSVFGAARHLTSLAPLANRTNAVQATRSLAQRAAREQPSHGAGSVRKGIAGSALTGARGYVREENAAPFAVTTGAALPRTSIVETSSSDTLKESCATSPGYQRHHSREMLVEPAQGSHIVCGMEHVVEPSDLLVPLILFKIVGHPRARCPSPTMRPRSHSLRAGQPQRCGRTHGTTRVIPCGLHAVQVCLSISSSWLSTSVKQIGGEAARRGDRCPSVLPRSHAMPRSIAEAKADPLEQYATGDPETKRRPKGRDRPFKASP
jgi:hypothetical protein